MRLQRPKPRKVFIEYWLMKNSEVRKDQCLVNKHGKKVLVGTSDFHDCDGEIIGHWVYYIKGKGYPVGFLLKCSDVKNWKILEEK